MDTPDRPYDDVHVRTREARRQIGFPAPEKWRDAPAYFDGHTLTIEGHPVMEDWETDYMRALAEVATSRGGVVLEVGFGMGISARFIQEGGVREHLIIESNRYVYDAAAAFARAARIRTRPLFGMWQDLTPLLPSGCVNGILFDTYPLSESELHRNHFPFFPEAYRLLAPGGVLTYYSDEIDDFSPEHLAALRAAGFSQIEKAVCPVSPPETCLYWQHPTILVPNVTR